MAEHWTFRQPQPFGLHIPDGEPIPGKTYRADGWAYVDPPGSFSPESWQFFLNVIGDGEYVVLASSNWVRNGIKHVRGQLLVSPAGWANMEATVKDNAHDR